MRLPLMVAYRYVLSITYEVIYTQNYPLVPTLCSSLYVTNKKDPTFRGSLST